MPGKSAVLINEETLAFAKRLVEQGRFESVDDAVEHGLNVLIETDPVEELLADDARREQLRAILLERAKGPFISSEEMKSRIDQMFEQKRRELGLQN